MATQPKCQCGHSHKLHAEGPTGSCARSDCPCGGYWPVDPKPTLPRGVKAPGRAQRVARIIAARFLNYWRDQRPEGIDPRDVSADKARDAFRFWECATLAGFRSWPPADLKLACNVASILITSRPARGARVGGSTAGTLALYRALGGR